MKTGVVLQIEYGKATVLQAGGSILTVQAKQHWQVGDVVHMKKARRPARAFYAAAACLVLLLLGGVTGLRLYTTETASISMEINPGLSLSLNRFGTVFAANAYNADGAALLADTSVTGKPYLEAVSTILASDALSPYLTADAYLDVSVTATRGEAAILEEVAALVDGFTQTNPGVYAACHRADSAFLNEAHAHGMSPGRYRAFLELQALEPGIDVEDYADAPMWEIREEIQSHHGYEGTGANGNGSGAGGGNGAGNANEKPAQGGGREDAPGQGNQHGHGHGYGRGGRNGE